MEPIESDDSQIRQSYFERLRYLAENVRRAFAEHEATGTPLQTTMREWGILYSMEPESDSTRDAAELEKQRQYYESLRDLGQRIQRAFAMHEGTGMPLEQAMQKEGVEYPVGRLSLRSVSTYDSEGRLTSCQDGPASSS